MSAEPVAVEAPPCKRRRYSTWSKCTCLSCKARRARIDKLRRSGKTLDRAATRKVREAGRRIIRARIADGWSPAAVASAYNVAPITLYRIVEAWAAGRDILPGVGLARIVLAGPVGRPTAGHVPAWPATRRLQALACQGWTNAALAARLGVAQSVVSETQAGRRALVSARVDTAVRVVYAELGDTDTKGVSVEAARRARAKRWAPPGAWDDIDDRDEHPKGATR